MAGGSATISIETPIAEGVDRLLAAADAFAAQLYLPEDCYGMDAAALGAAKSRFYVARIDGFAVGCVACIDHGTGYGEIKRLFVSDEARGSGVGAQLMQNLTDGARDDGIALLRLETGIHNVAALHLYRRIGFTEAGRFGSYPDNPVSIFLERRIA